MAFKFEALIDSKIRVLKGNPKKSEHSIVAIENQLNENKVKLILAFGAVYSFAGLLRRKSLEIKFDFC